MRIYADDVFIAGWWTVLRDFDVEVELVVVVLGAGHVHVGAASWTS